MKLSVIIPNRNDTVMLSITVRTVLKELKAIEGGGEIVIADNSDMDIWQILKTPNVSPLPLEYVAEDKIQLFHIEKPSLYHARAEAIRKARGEYSYNVDSHTLVGRDSLKDLVAFMDADKEKKVGFGFAPIGWFSKHELFARHDLRIDRGTVFGSWGRQYDKPTKICWNFGSRICRTKWFNEEFGGYGFFDKKYISWGGGEFYIPLKGWLLGYESWAVPTSPQYHIGPFSSEIESRTCYKFRQYSGTGNGKLGIGIFAAFYALGGDEMKEEARKAEIAGVGHQYGISVDKDWEEAKTLAHEDWLWIKERQKISYFELMEKQPWKQDGYGDWNNWKPYKKIPQKVDLSKLETLVM